MASTIWGWRYDALALIGAGSITTGAWLMWVPLGFLVGGIALVLWAWLGAAGAVRPDA